MRLSESAIMRISLKRTTNISRFLYRKDNSIMVICVKLQQPKNILELQGATNFFLCLHSDKDLNIRVAVTDMGYFAKYFAVGCYGIFRRGVVVITNARRHSAKPARRIEDSRWQRSLTMVPPENKAKHLSSVNHTTKTMHRHHPRVQFRDEVLV